MHVHPFFIVAAMTLFAVAGGICLKQFSVAREILWLVAGFCLYGLSNILFILVMDQSGLARAVVIASATQIILSSAAGYFLGEKLNSFHAAATVLACCAFALSFAGTQIGGAPNQSPQSIHISEEEATNDAIDPRP